MDICISISGICLWLLFMFFIFLHVWIIHNPDHFEIRQSQILLRTEINFNEYYELYILLTFLKLAKNNLQPYYEVASESLLLFYYYGKKIVSVHPLSGCTFRHPYEVVIMVFLCHRTVSLSQMNPSLGLWTLLSFHSICYLIILDCWFS